MTWDADLASAAAAYADGCVGDHPDEAGSSFGENLFMMVSTSDFTDADLVGGVQAWYDEIFDTVWASGDSVPKSKPLAQCKDPLTDHCNVGHYFAVIWAESNKVGCGVASCSSGMTITGTSYSAGVLMVCRYLPTPQIATGTTHTAPFIFGAACAGCADNCEDGLCTAAPTRCIDTTGWTIQTYTDCASLIAATPGFAAGKTWCDEVAALMSSEDACKASCGKCTAPAKQGAAHCGGSSETKSALIASSKRVNHHIVLVMAVVLLITGIGDRLA